MTDREKVINGLEEFMRSVHFAGLDSARMLLAVKDALLMLKEDERDLADMREDLQAALKENVALAKIQEPCEDAVSREAVMDLLNEYAYNQTALIEAANVLPSVTPKAHEPRVMMLEEVQALQANDVVWLEDKGKSEIIPGIVYNRQIWPHSTARVTNFMRWDGCTVTAADCDYVKRWRCWTSRPTDAQREATPWQ